MGLLQKIFGTHSENELKRIYPIVDEIEALLDNISGLTEIEENKDKVKELAEKLY